MGIFSNSSSIVRYLADGTLEKPLIDTVRERLKKFCINEIEDESFDKIIGWTLIDRPFNPNFDGSDFVFGPYFIFALRIDKKTIPSKLIKKHYSIQYSKELIKTGRKYLSKDEKKLLKGNVIHGLGLRIPATPNVYDVLWNYEEKIIYFLSSLKTANEEFETLFLKTFNIPIIRLFPFTLSDLKMGLSDNERDDLLKLTPTDFTG